MSRKFLIKTFFAGVILLTVCASSEAQIKTRLSPLGNLLAGIQERADNLVYISEEDWDVNVFVIGRNISVLNAERFQAANPFVAFEPIEEIPVSDFFTRLEKRDEAWTNLRNYLEANLISLKVFKVGTVRREVYAVGLFQGHIVGIRTFAVET
ncbi:MAG: hypothetical protein H0W58_07500 [Acidobacteria bacterium]|jgi:hypothetical protein|nr:hypothetical protein [Acidobacteriota bacterium]